MRFIPETKDFGVFSHRAYKYNNEYCFCEDHEDGAIKFSHSEMDAAIKELDKNGWYVYRYCKPIRIYSEIKYEIYNEPKHLGVYYYRVNNFLD